MDVGGQSWAQAAVLRGGQPRWWALPQPAPWGSVPLQAGVSRGMEAAPCPATVTTAVLGGV